MKYGYVQAYRNRFRNRLIRLLGGADPVHVGNLIYRSSLLVGLLKHGEFGRLTSLVNAQAECIKRVTMEIDPVYGIIKGYPEQLKQRVSSVAAGPAGRETQVSSAAR